MPFPSRRFPVFLPLIVLAGIGYALFVGSLLLGAERVDHAERVREQSLVANAVGQRLNEIGETLTGYVIWDEALEKLDNRFDPSWADTNIGRAMTHVLKFRTVYVLDAFNQPEFAADVNGSLPIASFASLAHQVVPLIAAVRAREAQHSSAPLFQSIQRSGIVLLAGHPVTVSVSLVRSEFGSRHPLHATAPLVVAVAPVDGEVERAFADRFLLDAAGVTVGRPPSASQGVAYVELARDAASGRSVTFDWRPKRPGSDLLSRSMPYLVLGSSCLIGGAAILLLQAWRANQGLVRS